MTIGEELERIRKMQYPTLSAEMAANYIGVKAHNLRKWEKGVTPKPDDIKKIETYFMVPIDQLHTIGKFKFYSREDIKLIPKSTTKHDQLLALTIAVKILQSQVDKLNTKVFGKQTTITASELEKLIKEAIKQLQDES